MKEGSLDVDVILSIYFFVSGGSGYIILGIQSCYSGITQILHRNDSKD